MTLTRRAGMAEVAATVARALTEGGVQAVLTGGACAMLYSKGAVAKFDEFQRELTRQRRDGRRSRG